MRLRTARPPALWGVAAALLSLLSCAAAASPADGAAGPAAAAQAMLAGRIFTVAGSLRWSGPSDDSGLAAKAQLVDPVVAALPGGGFLIADSADSRVLRVSASGRFAVVAGNGGYGFSGDGGPATSASLSSPDGVVPLGDGGFLIADTDNGRIRRVWPDGHISTVAGNGDFSFSGDGGPATSASLWDPEGVAALRDGGFLIADTRNSRIRRVWPDGHISTVAGTGHDGFSGDGRPATRASLSLPESVAALPDGGFLIADTFNARVRRVAPNGRISTVAGNGREFLSGDGGPATSAAVDDVASVAAVSGGGFLIGASDGSGHGVRRVWPDGHISSLVATRGGALYGDGGPARAARLYGVSDLDSASVAALPGGGALIGYGTSVRLVVGRRRTSLLAAAIRPLASAASRREYRARVVLSHRAHVTIRVYRSPDAPPVAMGRAVRSAGEGIVAVRLSRRVTPGLYAVDLTARSGSQTTRAEQYVFLGGSVTRASIRSIEENIIDDEFADDPNAGEAVERCHRFSSLRVDCAIEGDYTYIEASWLTTSGQLRARSYHRPPGSREHLFRHHPRWNGRAIWHDLGAAWDPEFELEQGSAPFARAVP